MTVTYTAEVATCRRVGCFSTVLLRWRGSIYKLVWMDLAVFVGVYYVLSFIYRFALNAGQQRTFEQVAFYFQSYLNMVPVAFVLGFFVQIVMTRWWEQYTTIPWPDAMAVYVSAHIHGQDDRARLMRRTIMRYACLTQAIVFTMIAPKVKKRFPTLQNLVDVGLMQENEKSVFEAMDESFPKVTKYWMPIIWAASIVSRARKEGRIRDDFAVKTLVDELNKFRGQCGSLLIYDWIPIPLVYTQVVTVAVYSFFLGAVLGMQWTYNTSKQEQNTKTVNYYIPIFTLLQFFFYMGWLKVAESLINPFGEDDDDFEVNWMIDRNLQVSYLIVDEMHQDHPDLVKDQYWDEVFPTELPYDGDSKREEQPEVSTAKLNEKGRLQLPLVVVDRNSNEANQPKREDSTKRIRAEPSSTSTGKFSGDYKSARASIVTFESDEETSTPRQKTEDTQPRVKIVTGTFEPSDSDDFEALPPETVKETPKTEAPQPDTTEKDDFTRLKEQRDRLRAARQKLRFVQQIGDLANVSLRQDPRAIELTGEISEEDEEEEDLEEEFFEDYQTNSTI